MASHKLVVIGDINGRILEVFGKLATLHSKQSFAFAIVAGNLFADPAVATDADNEQITQLLSGKIEIALPTYFTLGRHSLPPSVVEKLESNAGELCPNLSVLDRKVSIKTSEGFRIVAVGGTHMEAKDQPSSAYDATFKDTDVESLTKTPTEADILVTNDWPANILTGSKRAYTDGDAPKGAQSLSELCSTTKPRYHFAASPSFLEREPFFHSGPTPRPITRFISLAPYGNPTKQKWIYAFSLTRSSTAPDTLPAECTASPFTTKKRKASLPDGTNFRYAQPTPPSQHQTNRGKRQRNQPPPGPQQCFFCLSNPSCETHMITSIANETYLTIAKGPLTTPSTNPSLPFPSHILLIPHSHVPTLTSIASDETRTNVLSELEKYRTALHAMLTARSAGSLGAVAWEISRAGGVHMHQQFLPVPAALIEKGLVEAAFDVEAENSSYPKFVKGSEDSAEMNDAEEADYFKAQLWTPNVTKTLVLPLDATFRFDLQFARRVLGKLLGLEDRTHWRDCAQTHEEEEKDKEAFSAAFKEFDFSLADE